MNLRRKRFGHAKKRRGKEAKVSFHNYFYKKRKKKRKKKKKKKSTHLREMDKPNPTSQVSTFKKNHTLERDG